MTDFDAIAQGMTQAVPFAGLPRPGDNERRRGRGRRCVLPERAELTNHVGSQHAGALFTVAETASGAAFVGAFAERLGEVTPLARSAEISYEKIAKGPIEASARLGIADGRGARHPRRRGQGRVPLRDRAGRRLRPAGRHGDGPLARAAEQARRRRGMSAATRADRGYACAMAVKLHRCSNEWVKINAHPCWKVQKALDQKGVDYEVVKGPLRASKRDQLEQALRPAQVPRDRVRGRPRLPRGVEGHGRPDPGRRAANRAGCIARPTAPAPIHPIAPLA